MLIVIHFQQVETRLSAIYRESAPLQTGNNQTPKQVPCNLTCKRQFLVCPHTPTSATGETALCTAGRLQLQLCHYVTHLDGGLAQGSLTGRGGSAGSRGRALPYVLWGNRVMHQHNPSSETRVKCQHCAPPWGFCHTPREYCCQNTPHKSARVQRYMEFAGRNTTKWNHCIWKCVFSCPKSSVHKQNCKCYMYKP